MWVYAGIATGNRLMLLVIAAKVILETLGFAPVHEGFVTVALAHQAGALAGLAALPRRMMAAGSAP